MSIKVLLSVAITTFNEAENIAECLKSVQAIADEIVIVDGFSKDKTVEIARQFGAKVVITENNPNFHINKQKAFDLVKGNWVLYLDADERVSPALAKEIKLLIRMNESKIEEYEQNIPQKDLFLRHQLLIEQRDGKVGTKDGEYVAFFIPRRNFFLGKYLHYGGVYPDGVIRLFKRDKAYLPGKNIHEQMVVKGKVGWLANDLYHKDSPTFKRYLIRNSRYIDLLAIEMQGKKTKKNILEGMNYLLLQPVKWFLMSTIRHKGILDGYQGLIFAFFSALRFPRAYIRYLKK